MCIEGKRGHRSDHSNVVSDLQIYLRVKKTWIWGLRPEPPISLETPLEVAISPGYAEISVY